MIISDSVLIQQADGTIVRPSDIGVPTVVMESLEMTLINGTIIRLVDNFYMKVADNGEWIHIDDLNRSSELVPVERVAFPEPYWDCKIDLADVCSAKTGIFDIGTEEFAEFLGAFIVNFFASNRRYSVRNSVVDKYSDVFNKYFEKEFLLRGRYKTEIRKCWMIELIDALFDFDNLSIMDDMIFGTTAEWCEAFLRGVMSCLYYDETVRAWVIGDQNPQFYNDLALLAQHAGKFIRITFRDGGNRINPLDEPPNTKIIRGNYVSGVEQQLYDIGDGIFNVSGVILASGPYETLINLEERETTND